MASAGTSPTPSPGAAPRRRVPLAASLPAKVALGLLVTSVFGVTVEGAVRILRPDVFGLGVPSELYAPSRFGDSPGWRPGVKGRMLGAPMEIDQRGCRLLPDPGPDVRERWLILGDSVAFGMGVDAEETFAAGLQRSFEGVEVLNTAVVGYGVGNFAPVLRSFLATEPPPDRVLYFFTLNDASYDWTNESIASQADSEETILGWVERQAGAHVRTYQLAKGLLLDRSAHYYLHDAAPLLAGGEQLDRTVDILVELGEIAEGAGVPLDTFLFPYEAQLREDGDGVPQALLGERLAQRGMPSHDLVGPLRAATGGDSRSLFLFSDAMHFSVAGHAAVLDAVVASITPRDP